MFGEREMTGKDKASKMTDTPRLARRRVGHIVIPLIVGSFMLAGCPSKSGSHSSDPPSSQSTVHHQSTMTMSPMFSQNLAPDPPASVPEPPELPLFVAGLGLLYLGRRRVARRKQSEQSKRS